MASYLFELVIGTLFLIIDFVVIYYSNKSITNILFFLFSFFLGLAIFWSSALSIFMFYSKLYGFLFSLLDNIKFIFLSIGIILSSILIFYYPYKKAKKFNKSLLLFFIPIIYVIWISLNRGFIIDVYFEGIRIIKTRSVHFLIITFLNLFYIILSFIIGIIRYIKNKTDIKIKKSIAIYITCLVLGGFGATLLIMMPFYFNNYDYYYNIIGYILLLIVYCFILYSILKQQSFDFKSTIHYTGFWILFIFIYLCPILIIPIWIKTTYEKLNSHFVIFFWSLLLLLYYFLISYKVLPFVKRITFRKKRILTDKLLTIKSVFDSITNVEILILEMFKIFSDMFYSKQVYLIINGIKGQIYSQGQIKEFLEFSAFQEELINIDSYEDILNINQIKLFFNKNSRIQQYSIQVLSRLKYHDKLIGFILLGVKTNNKKYDFEEINLIKTISNYFSSIYFKLMILNEAIAEKISIKQKNDFFINLIHELKTPLTLIQTNFNEYLQSLNNEATPQLNTTKYYLNKLCRDIVNQFDSEKIERGFELYNHNTITDISNLLVQVINLFRPITNKKNISISLSCENSLYSKIDPSAFERIINNLIDNAIKYIGNGNSIEVNLASDNTNIHFIVEDNGLGIPKEQHVNIFQPYYQMSREKSNVQGLGLGLSIVKHIVDSVSGVIKLESKIDKGTKVIITLQMHTVTDKDIVEDYIPEEHISEIDNTLTSETYEEKKYTVLYVEDNLDLIKTMKKKMNDYFNFYYAMNGLEALRELERIPLPDIIIADIMMDVMDGHEFYAELKERIEYSDIPVIFLTARTVQKEKVESLNKGIIDYIYKPFCIEELIKNVLVLLKYRQTLIEKERKDIDAKLMSLLYSKKDLKTIKYELKCKEFELSPREKEIAKLLLKGKLYKEIAHELEIKTTTVSKHIRTIYNKCSVHSNLELVILFME